MTSMRFLAPCSINSNLILLHMYTLYIYRNLGLCAACVTNPQHDTQHIQSPDKRGDKYTNTGCNVSNLKHTRRGAYPN